MLKPAMQSFQGAAGRLLAEFQTELSRNLQAFKFNQKKIFKRKADFDLVLGFPVVA